MKRRAARDVVWSNLAVGDLEELSSYVAADDPAAAIEVEDRILSATARLATHPGRGRVVPELLHLGLRQYRELIVAPYRIVYRAAGAHLVILAVLHGARDALTALQSRLTRPRSG